MFFGINISKSLLRFSTFFFLVNNFIVFVFVRFREEMENIKSKILDASEKYSLKCLECASLEEHLEVTTEKLTEANTLVRKLREETC